MLDTSPVARDDKQPWVLPSFDYAYTPDEPVAGGELNVKVNARELVRDRARRSRRRACRLVRGIEGDERPRHRRSRMEEVDRHRRAAW